MGEMQPPTTADYAMDRASSAATAAVRQSEKLDRLLRVLVDHKVISSRDEFYVKMGRFPD